MKCEKSIKKSECKSECIIYTQTFESMTSKLAVGRRGWESGSGVSYFFLHPLLIVYDVYDV